MNFEKDVFSNAEKKADIKRLTQSKFSYNFIKTSSKRTTKGKVHLEAAMKKNWYLSRFELTKESFNQFFAELDIEVAWKVFDEIGDRVNELGSPPLIKWWESLKKLGYPYKLLSFQSHISHIRSN